MECNIKEIGGQIVKSSNGKSAIRARVKNLPIRKCVTLLLLKSMGIAEPTCRVTGVLLGEEQKCVAIIPATMRKLPCDCTKTVLSRCKACNVTALAGLTCTVIEKYQVRRLRSFANSRKVGPRLLSQALLKKAVCPNTDNITRVTVFTYLVASERSDEKYDADISVDI
jgi:hypothetical protein